MLTGGRGADVFVFKNGHGQDTIKEFEDHADTIQPDDALWSGTPSKKKVVKKCVSVSDDDIVFDFGKHEVKMNGFNDVSELKDDIEIV